MFKIFGVLAVLGFSHVGFAAAAPLTDAEGAKVLITINEGEIDAGKMAASKSNNKEVQSFAKMMVDEHKKNVDDTKKVAKDRKLKTKDSDLSRSLTEEAKNSNKDLKDSTKDTFDKAYVQQQVTMHEKALAALNDTLIPNAKDPEYKAHLEKTKQAVETHLHHAEDLNSKLQ